ncbi:hypothetical protein GBAR_LOCUS11861, partial [Geodia barretti]
PVINHSTRGNWAITRNNQLWQENHRLEGQGYDYWLHMAHASLELWYTRVCEYMAPTTYITSPRSLTLSPLTQVF